MLGALITDGFPALVNTKYQFMGGPVIPGISDNAVLQRVFSYSRLHMHAAVASLFSKSRLTI